MNENNLLVLNKEKMKKYWCAIIVKIGNHIFNKQQLRQVIGLRSY